MKRRTSLFCVTALSLLGAQLLAEDPRSYSYHTAARPQSAEEVEDLGVVAASPEGEKAAAKRGADGKEAVAPAAPVKSNFRFNVSARGEYTSNAKLSGSNSSSDFIALPTIEGGYNTPLGKYFTFDIAGRIESAFYADNSDRGFVGYGITTTLDYRPKKGAPRLYISAEPYRYDGFDEGDLITQAIGLTAGTDWGIPFNNGRSLAFAGLSYGHYFADPSSDTLNSYRAVVGLAHQFRSDLTGQVYYSYQYNDFPDYGRHDSRNFAGANLIYQFNERVFGSVTATFVDNDSSVDVASYQSITGSVGVTVSF